MQAGKIPTGKPPQKPAVKIIRVVDVDENGDEIPGTEEFWIVDSNNPSNVLAQCKTLEEAQAWIVANGFIYSPSP